MVIDDYPSLVEAVPQFPIHLRDLLDTYKDTSRLKHHFDGKWSGAARWPHHWRTQPHRSVRVRILRGETILLGGYEILGPSLYAKDDLRTVFAVTGGLPAYVQYFDNGESIDTNIINLFFSVSGALFEETQNILHRDMKT